MSNAKYFLQSQVLKDDRAVEIDGNPVVERHALITRIVSERCGRDAANLFAEPRLTRSNGVSAARIDWYSSFDGVARPLAELDPGSMAAVRQKIEVRLAAIRALLGDPEIGPFLSAALNLARPDGLVSVGGEPVILLWGTLPAAAFDDTPLRERLFIQSLADFLPGAPLPPVSREEWQRALHGTSAPAVSSSTVVPGVAGVAAPPPARPVVRRRAGLLAPAIACGLAALLTGVLFWPGILVFPAAERTPDAATRASLAELIAKLQAKLAILDTELKKDCTTIRAGLDKLFPKQAAEIPVTVPPVAAVGGQQQAAPGSPAAEPPPAEAPVVRPPDVAPPAAGPMNLADRAERGVVLVSTADGSGTGFFISRDTIVTNRHVVAQSQNQIRAISKYIGVVPARLLAMGTGEHYDYAILRVAPQNAVAPFVLTTSGQQLQPVVSSGFPGLQLRTDPAIQRLLEGDATNLQKIRPNAAPGAVMSLLQQEDDTTLVVHTATIAPGNSGGPLLDQCGRVVGVNTFGVTDRKMPVTFFYALGIDGLKRFLTSKGFSVSVEDSACAPQMVAAAPPAPGGPAPGAAALPQPAPGSAPNPEPAPAAGGAPIRPALPPKP